MDNLQPDLQQTHDPLRELVLDGNAVAGLLVDIFAIDVTASLTECAACGQQGEMGSLLAFNQAPGIVLRCPACENVMLRIVETPEYYYIDARGSLYLRLEKS